MISILAIDLGTKMGWAQGTLSAPDNFSCGDVALATAKEITANGRSRLDRTGDPRIQRLHAWLDRRYATEPFDWLIWEDVLFSTTTMQTQLWSSFRSVLWLFAAQRAISTECCPVSTLKKFATRSGAADKEHMATALVRSGSRFIFESPGKFIVKDQISGNSLLDNAIDAIHLLRWGYSTLKNYERPSATS